MHARTNRRIKSTKLRRIRGAGLVVVDEIAHVQEDDECRESVLLVRIQMWLCGIQPLAAL